MLSADIESTLNLLGIAAFSLSGALMAVRRRFDIVGICALATVTALGGGLIRDALISIRPRAFDHPAWFVVPLAAAVAAFFFHPQLNRLRIAIEIFDAIGLGVFAVTATATAFTYGIHPVAAVFLGSLTGVGGGVVRDVLAGITPALFSPTSRLYAVPAVLGCTAIAVTHHLGTVTVGVQVAAAAGTCLLRLVALWRGWTAPVPKT